MAGAALRARALRALAQREHSRAELGRKLMCYARAVASAASGQGPAGDAGDALDADNLRATDAGFDDDNEPAAGDIAGQIQQLLDQLAASGLLNEARVAESLVAAKAPRFGERRLRQMLQTKGLEGELVDRALAGTHETELERAREVWRRRFGSLPPGDAREQARQWRFLAARGFGGEVIRRLLRPRDDGAGA